MRRTGTFTARAPAVAPACLGRSRACDVRWRGRPGLLVSALVWLGLTGVTGCGAPSSAPEHPTWSDVAPVLRGSCGGCHGWTASDRPPSADGVHPVNTGASLRLDFYDVTPEVCGDAALAVDATGSFAGAPGAAIQMKADVSPQNGARWPRMPPQPSSGLAGWEIETIERWAASPTKGPPPAGNRAPTVSVSQLSSAANQSLAFTAILQDPDGDSVMGVVEVAGLAFLMNRPGAFAVQFDASSWPSGLVHPVAVVCDGWTQATYDLGPIQIQH